ncbi:AAA family ATPase [Streptomyces sp. NBC_00310]
MPRREHRGRPHRGHRHRPSLLRLRRRPHRHPASPPHQRRLRPTYALPIVVACLTAQPGGLVLLENPEAHLHPHGQTKMAELAASAAAQGAQLVVETHSDHVLNGIRLAVKRGPLTSEQAVVHFFRSTNGSGVEVITPHIERQQQKDDRGGLGNIHVESGSGAFLRYRYRHIVVDEAQDLSAAHWKMLRAMVPATPTSGSTTTRSPSAASASTSAAGRPGSPSVTGRPGRSSDPPWESWTASTTTISTATRTRWAGIAPFSTVSVVQRCTRPTVGTRPTAGTRNSTSSSSS